MKKLYQSPSIECVALEMERMIAASNFEKPDVETPSDLVIDPGTIINPDQGFINMRQEMFGGFADFFTF